MSAGNRAGKARDRQPALSSLSGLSSESILERVDELLEAKYGSAPLGNVRDPLDELIFIVLSSQTGPTGYRRTYDALKERFPTWDSVLEASEAELKSVLRPAGLSRQKSRTIRAIIARVAKDVRGRSGRKGRANLDFLQSESDASAEAYLTSLPGVSTKTARCVLMYSLDRQVFPVDGHIHRVLTRLGAIPALDRKKVGDVAQDAIRRGLRLRLHINLIHHGRAVCRPRTPKCNECPLISFCDDGLKRFRQVKKPPRPLAIDLFAGPGGLSAGFANAGYKIVFAAEKGKHAAQTYRFNHLGVPTFEIDVAGMIGRDVLRIVGVRKGEIAVVLGGPPCQGYSQAGKRNPGHPDNHLYREFVRVGGETGARLLVMENVPGVHNVRGKAFVRDIEKDFLAHGFAAKHFLLNAAAFGVPQNRRRVLFLAAPRKSTLVRKLSVPLPRNRLSHNGAEHDPGVEGLAGATTVEEALAGLPARKSGEGHDAEEWQGQWLYNHVAMRHSAAVTRRIQAIAPGAGPISYRRLQPKEPGRTIIAGHRALPLHPYEHRTITVREAARLQSFADGFRFLGPRAEQPLQVANAVPPLLGEAIARHVRSWLGPAQSS